MMTPEGTTVIGRSASVTSLEVGGVDDERPDLLVGAVPLVWWDRSDRAAAVSFMEVPPPEPFVSTDIEAMWTRLLDSSLPSLESVPLQGRVTGGARRDGYRLRSEAVPRALAACRRMLGDWPELEASSVIWRPVDMRGGREDLATTDRRAGARLGTVTSDGVAIPDRVARRHRSSIRWRSDRLAVACRTLAKALREVQLTPEDGVFLARPLDWVAERASSGGASLDPPVSSWPHAAQAAFGAVLNARIALAFEGAGSRHVPLSHIWRLYENWLVTRVEDALTGELGAGEEIQIGATTAQQWQAGSVLVRVHPQATIGRHVDRDFCGHPDGLVSVSSDLRPDVLVSVSDPAGVQAVVCVDAKRRIAQSAMDASEVAAAASKYVWGIRSGADLDELVVASTIVASSARLPDMHDEGRSRVSTRFLLPSAGVAEFDALVVAEVRRLVMSVQPR